MSERYSRLFSLPENLYAEGAPVVIAAGALLKDNETGRVIAQLKLCNTGLKIIKAATVSLLPLNTVGNSLGEAIRYEYLDLSSTRDTDFGSKSAIPMLDATTRSFNAAVVEVIFTDNSVWSANEAAWEPLKSPEPLTSRLDNEMVKQFQIEYGSGAKNFLLEQKDLWHCVCGTVNRQGETVCHSCRKSIYDLKKLDLKALKERKEQRVAREGEQAARETAVARENARKIKKIAISAVILVATFIVLLNVVIIPNVRYWNAEKLLNNGEIAKAAIAFNDLGPFRDSKQRSLAQWESLVERKTIAAGDSHTVGLKADGTVVATGDNTDGQCNVSDWTNIVAIAAGFDYTVGLKADGTVVAVGDNSAGSCDVSGWTDIVAIDADRWYTVGLKADGTVVVAGKKHWSYTPDISGWTDIMAIASGETYIVGLKTDGTVLTTGDSHLWGWRDIIAITAYTRTVGLKADGTVVTDDEKSNVSDWFDIVAVAKSSRGHTFGLKADGTVTETTGWGDYSVSDWRDIIAIDTSSFHTIGLKADGTIVAKGWNDYGQCNVSDWKDIKVSEHS